MARTAVQRSVRCYLCSHRFEVSSRTMSTTCPGCNRAIKVEDVVVKSYVPVIDLQTCGMIRIAKRGRVAAQRIQAGAGIMCEGAMEGTVETEGDVELGPKASWKGKSLKSRSLSIADGAKLLGAISVEGFKITGAQPEQETPKKPRRGLLGALRRPKASETVEVKPKTAGRKKTAAGRAPSARRSTATKKVGVKKTKAKKTGAKATTKKAATKKKAVTKKKKTVAKKAKATATRKKTAKKKKKKTTTKKK